MSKGKGRLYAADFKSGMDVSEVARKHGVSRQCVHQYVQKLVPNWREIQGERASSKRESTALKAEANYRASAEPVCRRTYGCSIDEYERAAGSDYRDRASNPFAARYLQQRNNARRRGIEWSISFFGWMSALTESGHANDSNYAVGRKSTEIGFTASNIVVKTIAECCRDVRLEEHAKTGVWRIPGKRGECHASS